MSEDIEWGLRQFACWPTCMLVLIGATPEGKKELLGFQTGMRERRKAGRSCDLKMRGLAIAPEIAVGDGALGFWRALDEGFRSMRHQRCWVHKTLNVLDKLPKSVQPNAHKDLREIWLSPSRAAAEAALATFAEKHAPKYDKAVDFSIATLALPLPIPLAPCCDQSAAPTPGPCALFRPVLPVHA